MTGTVLLFVPVASAGAVALQLVQLVVEKLVL